MVKGLHTAIVLLAASLLGACSTVPVRDLPVGVYMSHDDRRACMRATEKNPCTVWTVEELNALAQQAYEKGFEAGQSHILFQLRQEVEENEIAHR